MKILLLDIETRPNLVAAWGLFKQNIAINQILKPGATICWAAKWLGKREVMFRSSFHDGERNMVEDIHKLIEEADAVITYNGKKFDLPTLNKEFALHKLPPPAPYKNIDLYNTARQQFRFASNKLDYICQQLGLGSKVKHKGMELWRDCMDDVEKAWKEMRRYNIQDVKLLEKLYKYLLPWIKHHPNYALYDQKDRPCCTNCGGTKLQRRGERKTATMVYPRYQCQSCFTWVSGRRSLLTTEEKTNVLTKDNTN